MAAAAQTIVSERLRVSNINTRKQEEVAPVCLVCIDRRVGMEAKKVEKNRKKHGDWLRYKRSSPQIVWVPVSVILNSGIGEVLMLICESKIFSAVKSERDIYTYSDS